MNDKRFRITMVTVAEPNMPLEYDLSLLEHSIKRVR